MSRVCLTLGLTALAAGPVAAQIDQRYDQGYEQNSAVDEDAGSYGYLRVVEGSATLIQSGEKEGNPADVNQPVLAGDRIWVAEGSKVEIVLADLNIVRLDGGSELLLEHLAESPDTDDPTTVLRLLEGNMQVVVTDDSLGDELPRLVTPNATILPQDFGTYRVTTSDNNWSEVTVRAGQAEVEGGDGDAETVESDESAVIEGIGQRASIEVDDASGIDGLERWAQRMDQDSRQADVRYVDSDLRYSASSLGRHGSWVTVENETYWRPQVAADWRPYWHGRWAYTPSGMTWVSYEPWGWVPYHYGSWDYVGSYGWLWRPGRVYSPAWVYWYWGSDYTGWCPIGYYTHYYSARVGNPGFRSGVYGWAGGDWGLYARWNFVSTSYFGGYRNGHRNGSWDGRRGDWRDQRDVRRFAVPNDQRRGGRALNRGIITTDTRGLTPDTLRDPRQAVQVLAREPQGRGGNRGGRTSPGNRGGDTPLTDVTPFIARRPDLPANVTQVLRSNDGNRRLDGTPLRPATLGRGDRGARSNSNGREPGAVIPGGDRTPRVGREVPGNPGTSRGNQGGAQRPDRADRTGREPGAAIPDSGRTPRVGRSIPGGASSGSQGGGAPRPDRTERPRTQRPPRNESPATSNDNSDGARTPRVGRSIPSNQGSQGSQDERQRRPAVRQETPQRREPQASERPAPRVEPRPAPDSSSSERQARPREKPPERKPAAKPERQNNGREKSRDDGGRRGNDRRGNDNADDDGGR